MADITITVPDGKLETFVESIGKTEDGQDAAARSALVTTWLHDMARQHLWNYERSTAANAVPDPHPPAE